MPDAAGGQRTPVGAQIRDLRKARGMTIQALAERIGRSVGYVSQIERNMAAISIPVLSEVARALGVGINFFFQESTPATDDERGIVVRRGNRRRLDFSGSGMVEELLSPGFSGAFEVIEGRFEAGGETGEAPYRQSGEAAGVVLEGTIELALGGHTYVLEPGDAVTYSRTEAHRARNVGDGPARVLWIVAPPSY